MDSFVVEMISTHVSAPFGIPIRAGGDPPVCAATVGYTTQPRTLILEILRKDIIAGDWLPTSSTVKTITDPGGVDDDSKVKGVLWDPRDLGPNIATVAGRDNAVRLRFRNNEVDTITGGVEFRMG